MVEYVVGAGYQDAPLIGLALFRILYAASCLIKFGTEATRGYREMFRPTTFLYFMHHGYKPRWPISERLYLGAYRLRPLAAVLLLCGIAPRLALSLLVCTFWLEMQVYFKFHVNFLFLVACCMLFAPSCGSEAMAIPGLIEAGSIRGWIDQSLEERGSVFAHATIAVTVTFMYLSTGWRKLTPAFLRGIVCYGSLQHSLGEREKRRYFDGWYPPFIARYLAEGDERTLQRRWAPLACSTVAIEFMLPCAMWLDSTQMVAVGVGATMHLAFTVLYPGTLAHFSLVTISTYLLFLDPFRVHSTLSRLL